MVESQVNIEFSLRNAFMKEDSVSAAYVGNFCEDADKIIGKLRDWEEELAKRWQSARNTIHNATKELDHQGNFASDLIVFEVDMFKQMLREATQLKEATQLELDQGQTRKKLHLWQEIVSKADILSQDAKKEFSKKGFRISPLNRRARYQVLVESHAELLRNLIQYKDYLPEDIKADLIDINDKLQSVVSTLGADSSLPDKVIQKSTKPTEIDSGEVRCQLPSVFISYSHDDSDIAEKLRTTLESENIKVQIDKKIMEPGADIDKFIFDSIRNTEKTIVLVSHKSLTSAWVAMELLRTLFNEQFDDRRKLIPCYTDEDFFSPGFLNKAANEYDKKINELNNEVDIAQKENLPYRSLADKVARLNKAKNGLDDILRRLEKSLCLDIRDNQFDESLRKIVDKIKGSRSERTSESREVHTKGAPPKREEIKEIPETTEGKQKIGDLAIEIIKAKENTLKELKDDHRHALVDDVTYYKKSETLRIEIGVLKKQLK